ncbi:MAG: TIGR03009 domain-containing protein, partial [Pirellulales bacterium]|nr:TIGR03009 domain-containing protein [Pirellulales bacterium]
QPPARRAAGPPLAQQAVRQAQAPPRPNQPPPATAPPAPAEPMPPAPRAPFQLTAAEAAELDLVLKQWEQATQGINDMSCAFDRWETDQVFNKVSQAKGELKYRSPDKGLYRVDNGEHWICDGQSVFEFDAQQKQVIERQLPPELQGKAIVDGPLPFLFNAEVAKLKQRYWMRIVTPADQRGNGQQGSIWIEAYPRHQRDAANFSMATLILQWKGQNLLPYALRVVLPGGKKFTDHQFHEVAINSPLRILQGDFSKPKIPSGWKLVQAQTAPPPPQMPAAPPGAQPPAAANRVPAGPRVNTVQRQPPRQQPPR